MGNYITFKTVQLPIMNKKIIFGAVGILAIVASVVMYKMSRNSHTTELKDYWWIPLPLGFLCLIIANSKKEKG